MFPLLTNGGRRCQLVVSAGKKATTRLVSNEMPRMRGGDGGKRLETVQNDLK